MFNAIKSSIRRTLIKIDYARYEDQRRRMHQAEANHLFDTSRLSEKASDIRKKSIIEGDRKFGNEINDLRMQVSSSNCELNKIRTVLSYFYRDYKSELDNLYCEKERLLEEKGSLISEIRGLKLELSNAYSDLDDAFDEFNDANDGVHRWHAKSKRSSLLFGNSGRRLPKRSIFGQSHGDLSAEKHRRSDAAGDISDCKEEISEIKKKIAVVQKRIDLNYSNVGEIINLIELVKSDRQIMFDHKKNGFNLSDAKNSVEMCEASLRRLTDQLNDLEAQRLKFINENNVRMGLSELENLIAEQQLKHYKFLEEFDLIQNRTRRQEAHFEWWMNIHG